MAIGPAETIYRAILIEYLPNSLPMNCVTYSKEHMNKAITGIQQIHPALVEHNYPYPKNILIITGDPERVVWIDLDVTITYPNNTYAVCTLETGKVAGLRKKLSALKALG